MLAHKYSLPLNKRQASRRNSIMLQHSRPQVKSHHTPSIANKSSNFQNSEQIIPSSSRYESSKSTHQIGNRTLYLKKIIKQRKSHSQISNKYVQSMNSSYYQHLQVKSSQNKLILPVNSLFVSVCMELEPEYRSYVENNQIDNAFQCLIKLLNYALDTNIVSNFFKILQIMCQFYESLEDINITFKMYNELREAALLMKDYKKLVNSLIKLSRCVGNGQNYQQAIIMLKKGLEYAWYAENKELELLVYDELGERYCNIGELRKANFYHMRYSSGEIQALDSPLRVLSKQKVNMHIQANKTTNTSGMSQLFLAHLSLPLKNTQILPALMPDVSTFRSKLPLVSSYRSDVSSLEYQVKRLLKHWMLESETEEPTSKKMNIQDSVSKQSWQKYSNIVRRNQRLVRQGAHQITNPLNKQLIHKKMNLEQQIKIYIQAPGLEKNWYENIVKRVQSDQKRKLTEIKDAVLINKQIKALKIKHQNLKLLYRQLIKQLKM